MFESGDRVLQVDQMGQHWLRLEFLHFVSTRDGSVRLTVYGHLKRDRMYYAQVQWVRGLWGWGFGRFPSKCVTEDSDTL